MANHNMLSRRRDALSEQTKVVSKGLSADNIEGWGSYRLTTHCNEVMIAMICPNYRTGVVLLWNRTLDEANA